MVLLRLKIDMPGSNASSLSSTVKLAGVEENRLDQPGDEIFYARPMTIGLRVKRVFYVSGGKSGGRKQTLLF